MKEKIRYQAKVEEWLASETGEELTGFSCKMHSPQEKSGGGKEDYGFEPGHLVRLE